MSENVAERLAHIVERNEEYFPGMSGVAELMMAPAYLRAMGEPSMADGAQDAYRLLVLPSFKPAVSVRVTGSPDERLISRAWIGVPVERAGQRILDDSRLLTAAESASLRSAIERADFWRLPTVSNRGGLDGEYWILEGRREGAHRIAVRWSPRPDGPDAAFRSLCAHLMALAPPVVIPEVTAEQQKQDAMRRASETESSLQRERLRSALLGREEAAARHVRSRLKSGGSVTCPHCGRTTNNLRYKDRGADAVSFFICDRCGRSASGTEIEDGVV